MGSNSKKMQDIKRIVFSEKNLEMGDLFTTTRFKETYRIIAGRQFEKDGITIAPSIMVGKTPNIPEGKGVLTTSHYKLYLALVKLWQDQGRPIDNGTGFRSLYQIARELGIRACKENYKLIRKWIEELTVIPITWTYSFTEKLDDGTERLIQRTDFIFSILDHVFFQSAGEDQNCKGGVVFSRPIIRNLLAGYVKPCAFDQIVKIKTELALLIYQWADPILCGNEYAKASLKTLWAAFGLSDEGIRWESDRVTTFRRVLGQLKGLRLSHRDGYMITGANITKQGSAYYLTVSRGEYQAQDNALDAYDPDLADRLRKYGLTDAQIKTIIETYTESVIFGTLEMMPMWEKQYRKQKKAIGNKAAFLYTAITERWVEKQTEDQTEDVQDVQSSMDTMMNLDKFKSKRTAEKPSEKRGYSLIEKIGENPSDSLIQAAILAKCKVIKIPYQNAMIDQWIAMAKNEGIQALDELLDGLAAGR